MMDEHDLTDPHGEAEALRKENARLRAELASGSFYKEADIDALMARAEAAEAALAEATDPEFIWAAMDSVHDCDTTMNDYAAAVSRAQRAALAASRALTAAPVAEAQPTIGGAELDALVAALRSGEQADMDGCMVKVSRQACEEAASAITALRAQPDWKAMAERLGDAGGKLDKAASEVIARGAQTGPQWSRLTAASLHFRAALSDLAKMKDSTK